MFQGFKVQFKVYKTSEKMEHPRKLYTELQVIIAINDCKCTALILHVVNYTHTNNIYQIPV